MVSSSSIQSTLLRHQDSIYTALRAAVFKHAEQTRVAEPGALTPFYGQMQYHLGWVDSNFAATQNNPGKLLRPTLLLLAYEAAGAWEQADSSSSTTDYLKRALPAAVAIELTHNFTLVHDDIEDGDEERRHRPTMWKVWGIPQAVNTGDGMFALARLTLWGVLAEGVDGAIAARLGAALDQACLIISEGQHLDISFEERSDVSVAMYTDMIGRKTAALMGCAAEMGAWLGTTNERTIESLRIFGQTMGEAFQVRDDLLSVWATSAESGKTQAGDIYRRKKSLPILHALEQANPVDQRYLRTLYDQKEPVTEDQVSEVLAIFERTKTQAYCRDFLARRCQLAYGALDSVPRHASTFSQRALSDLRTLVHFVAEAAS